MKRIHIYILLILVISASKLIGGKSKSTSLMDNSIHQKTKQEIRMDHKVMETSPKNSQTIELNNKDVIAEYL